MIKCAKSNSEDFERKIDVKDLSRASSLATTDADKMKANNYHYHLIIHNVDEVLPYTTTFL